MPRLIVEVVPSDFTEPQIRVMVGVSFESGEPASGLNKSQFQIANLNTFPLIVTECTELKLGPEQSTKAGVILLDSEGKARQVPRRHRLVRYTARSPGKD